VGYWLKTAGANFQNQSVFNAAKVTLSSQFCHVFYKKTKMIRIPGCKKYDGMFSHFNTEHMSWTTGQSELIHCNFFIVSEYNFLSLQIQN